MTIEFRADGWCGGTCGYGCKLFGVGLENGGPEQRWRVIGQSAIT